MSFPIKGTSQKTPNLVLTVLYTICENPCFFIQIEYTYATDFLLGSFWIHSNLGIFAYMLSYKHRIKLNTKFTFYIRLICMLCSAL